MSPVSQLDRGFLAGFVEGEATSVYNLFPGGWAAVLEACAAA